MRCREVLSIVTLVLTCGCGGRTLDDGALAAAGDVGSADAGQGQFDDAAASCTNAGSCSTGKVCCAYVGAAAPGTAETQAALVSTLARRTAGATGATGSSGGSNAANLAALESLLGGATGSSGSSGGASNLGALESLLGGGSSGGSSSGSGADLGSNLSVSCEDTCGASGYQVCTTDTECLTGTCQASALGPKICQAAATSNSGTGSALASLLGGGATGADAGALGSLLAGLLAGTNGTSGH
jgi:hypothetical protein